MGFRESEIWFGLVWFGTGKGIGIGKGGLGFSGDMCKGAKVVGWGHICIIIPYREYVMITQVHSCLSISNVFLGIIFYDVSQESADWAGAPNFTILPGGKSKFLTYTTGEPSI
jgi:hypothetical protein